MIKQLFCSHFYQFHHWVHNMNKNGWDMMILKCYKCGKTKFGGEFWMPDLLNNKCSGDYKDE